MLFKLRLIPLLAIVGLAATIASFVGGSVGSMIAGREPLAFLAVQPPHLEIPPGYPFDSAPVTNTMLSSWLSIVAISAIFILGTKRASIVPGSLQNALESICEFVGSFVEEMVGAEQERRMFPIVMTVFLFVVVNAWFGLLPGFETIKLNDEPLLRSANTDINVPLMLAVVCVFMVEYWGFRAHGLRYLGSFFNLNYFRDAASSFRMERDGDGMAMLFYGFIYLFVGILELLGHAVRVLSFSFRLFGNMTAGVVLTLVTLFLVPLVLPSVFYGLEAVFGLVQAVVFAGLTAVFGYAAVTSDEF